MKTTLRIILTNWINLFLIFVVVFVSGFFSAIFIERFTIGDAFFGTTFAILTYGSIFWAGFSIAICVLDIVLFGFNRNPRYTDGKLMAEWIFIASPLVYWLVKYTQWIFLIAVATFMVGQVLRKKVIAKILRGV